ncbi:Phospholipid-transporting ATPase [Sergentomyia squamirostris]
MSDLEDMRTKPSSLPINIKSSGGIPSASSSDSGSSDESHGTVAQLPTLGRKEPERTYIFPIVSGTSGSSLDSGLLSGSRGHARSVSHGGGAIASSYGSVSRPSALKSALRGHQRALSQGQITDSGTATSGQTTRSGHSRVGSKTDFILPPGHKEATETRDGTQSATSTGRGHSRQASRSESIYTLRRTELPPWWKRFFFFRHDKSDDSAFRTVVPNHTVPPKTPKREHPNGQRMGNKIHTTKYTMLSFLPKNLLEQFHRVANLYFIFIVLLNWFPAINAFGKEIAMIPVLFVLGVTAIKDLFEDRRRRSSDKRINNTTCRVYHGESERYKKVLWQDIRVGDLVHLSNNETVPADILLLRSSDPHGVCYIDTCDLDGETNLKRREVVRGFAEKQLCFSANKYISRVEVDAPSTKIYRFHGAMIHPTGEQVPLCTENLLLRESRLKNTDYAEGLVVYAGHETKAMLNNSGPRYKRSQLEQQMNIDVIWCVFILIILCVIGAVGCKMWLKSFEGMTVPFLPFEINPSREGLLTFWTFVIILQIMIPLSLYVTIELCKILQVYHIHNNIELYDPHTNKRTECRAMNITEELGQVQYIFSDKTGTLTENKMIFRRCAVNGIDYNHPPSEFEKDYLKPGSPVPPVIANPTLYEDMTATLNDRITYTTSAQRIQEFLLVLAICNTVVVSATPHRDLMNASGVIEDDQGPVTIVRSNDNIASDQRVQANNLGDRYTRLAESRSITPSPPPNSSSLKQHVPSLSPIHSSAESSPVSESPTKVHRQVPVSPTIRAQSIISSKLNAISSVLRNKHSSRNMDNRSQISPLRNQLSSQKSPSNGRPIFEAESPDELALVNAAFTYDCCLLNRSPNHVLISLPGTGVTEFEVLKILPFDSSRKCMSVILRRNGSHEITIYTKGADSSVMSCLTPCFPDSLEGHLREKTQQQLDLYARQGLRVLVMAKRTLTPAEYTDWAVKHKECEMTMESREKKLRDSFISIEKNLTLLGVTGIEDRLQEGVPETLSSLLSAGIVIWVLTGDKPETAINVAYSAKLFNPQMELLRLTARSRDAAETSIMFYLSEIERSLTEGPSGSRMKARALVVDGKTLTFILDLRSNLTKPFLKLTKYCASVLCCRSTPLQKAFLVKVVKEELHMRTLAIGDGANDVSMIQMADVGVGISGQEGMQAVMASDFTLSRFRLLEGLLLIHGLWCYDRLARMILYFFYKNATFVFLIFWYQLFCGFSGAVMIDQMYLMLYNLVFTSLPPLAIGVYDKCIPEDLLFSQPQLYRYGRMGKAYKPHTFWLVMLESLYQSLVIFFVAEATYWNTDIGIWQFGATIATSSLITMLLQCAIEIKSWTILHVLSIAISLGAFYVFSIFYNAVCVSCLGLPSSYWVIQTSMSTWSYWLISLLTAVLAVLPNYTIRTFVSTFWPDGGTKAIIQKRRNQQRGEDLLVAWSRSTSASSIYRTSDYGTKHQIVKTIS